MKLHKWKKNKKPHPVGMKHKKKKGYRKGNSKYKEGV
jgi:hypothetical protein